MRKMIDLSALVKSTLAGTCAVMLLSTSTASAQDPNAFNRIMKPAPKAAATLQESGIHDPSSPGIPRLQAPKVAFESLPDGNSGNKVDWVKALQSNKIQPRADRVNPDAKAQVMDRDIIRTARGTIGDVIFPHKAHTEWLGCNNCHSAIYNPKKDSNKMSMAMINAGESCGVCHGTVAFPVSECDRCHKPGLSKKK